MSFALKWMSKASVKPRLTICGAWRNSIRESRATTTDIISPSATLASFLHRYRGSSSSSHSASQMTNWTLPLALQTRTAPTTFFLQTKTKLTKKWKKKETTKDKLMRRAPSVTHHITGGLVRRGRRLPLWRHWLRTLLISCADCVCW